MTLHFIRPWFLLGLLPTIILLWQSKTHVSRNHAWEKVCDPPLLRILMKRQPHAQKKPLWLLLLSLCFVWLAAAGPAFQKISLPSYAAPTPKMILLNLSKHMLAQDLSPNRLQRAKFILQDLFNTPRVEPIGLIAYTQEPFNVSPLTDDTTTIQALLPDLDTNTPPIDGDNLAAALDEAATTMQQAKFKTGAILVLTGTPPDPDAIARAKTLKQQGIVVSLLPLTRTTNLPTAFTSLIQASGGRMLSLTHLPRQLKQWVAVSNRASSELTAQLRYFSQWKDEGRWFILAALLLLLPFFQQGRLRGLLG